MIESILKKGNYSIDLNNLFLIKVILPSTKIFVNKLPSFGNYNNYVFISNKLVEVPENCIFLSNNGINNLSNPDVFSNFIINVFGIKNKYVEYLNTLDFYSLLEIFKFLQIGFNIKDLVSDIEENNSLFNIIKALYGDFGVLINTYFSLKVNHESVFYYLLNFFNKSKELDLNKIINLKGTYLKTLSEFKSKVPEIQEAVKVYILSNRTEIDFIYFLKVLSKERYLC